MKCCNLQFSIMMILFSLLFGLAPVEAQVTDQKQNKEIVVETVDEVHPFEGKNKIQNGELYWVEIVSKLNNEELKSYINKKINEIMYVLEFDSRDGRRLFQVFITDPPMPSKDKQPKILFEARGFKYDYQKGKDLLDYLQIDIPFSLKEGLSTTVKLISSLALLIILLPVAYFGKKRFKTYKKNKRRKVQRIKKAREYVSLIKNAASRNEYEKIYANRKEIVRLVEVDESLFTKFLRELDAVQYQKEWHDEDENIIKKRLDSIKDCRVSRGI